MDDPFADLAVDETEERSEQAQQSREDRLRGAFLKSKAHYNTDQELIFTEPGWFAAPQLHAGAGDLLASAPADYTLHRLYARGAYADALALARAELAHVGATAHKENRAAHLLDIALRSAVHVHDAAAARELAACARAESKVRVLRPDAARAKRCRQMSAGLAESTAMALLAAGCARDALTLVLIPIAARGLLPQYARTLRGALELLRAAAEPHANAAFSNLIESVDAKVHRRLPRAVPHARNAPDSLASPEAPMVDEESLAGWFQLCDISGEDRARLHAALSAKTRQEADEKPERRVREL